MSLRKTIPILSLAAFLTACVANEKIRLIPFDGGLTQWAVEQMPGGSVLAKDGVLMIDDHNGCTVWLREKLMAPVEISYDVTVVMNGGANDRVSDINCFWMATDPASPGRPAGRSGKFTDYDSLRLYYVGMGGNTNTTTRFRRYSGDGSKPLLSGYDFNGVGVLLAPNVTYHLRVVARDGVAEFWRDGEKIFSFKDPAPLTAGWFGFRTVHSHLEIRNFHIRG